MNYVGFGVFLFIILVVLCVFIWWLLTTDINKDLTLEDVTPVTPAAPPEHVACNRCLRREGKS